MSRASFGFNRTIFEPRLHIDHTFWVSTQWNLDFTGVELKYQWHFTEMELGWDLDGTRMNSGFHRYFT